MPLERVSDGQRVGLLGLAKDGRNRAKGRRIVFIPWDRTEGAEWTMKTNNWNVARDDKFTIVHYDPSSRSVDLIAANQDPDAVVYIRGHGNPGFPYIMANHTPPDHVGVLGLVLPITDACQRLIDSGLGKDFSGAIKFYSCHSGTKPTKAELGRFTQKWKSEQENFTQLHDTNLKRLEEVKKGKAVIDKNKKDPKTAQWGVALSQRDIEVQLEISAETLKKAVAQNKSLARIGADFLREKGFNSCVFYGYLGPLGSTYDIDPKDLTGRHMVHKVVELEGLEKRQKTLRGLTSTRPSVARVRV